MEDMKDKTQEIHQDEKDMIKDTSSDDHKKEKKNKHKEEVDKLKAEIAELKDRLLRNAAELDNFKKRMHQERILDRKYASKTLIHDLMIPLDQLDKVVRMETDQDFLKNFLIGFKMINDQLFNILMQDGLKEIETKDKPFDPKIHHAVEKISDPNQPNNVIVEVIQKGYTYKDQLLRPAMVKINEWSEENGKDK